jgi:SAM-dependent methyltransferase
MEPRIGTYSHVLPNFVHWRNADHRERWLSGIKSACAIRPRLRRCASFQRPNMTVDGKRVSDRRALSERPYRIDDAWSRTVHGRRTGEAAAFLSPYLRPGMRLIDCGCGPGSITADLAELTAPGLVVGVDLRPEALGQTKALARQQGVTNLAVVSANIHRLPYAGGDFDAAFACAVLQHLADPVAALIEIRRVLKPGGVLGIADGSSPMTFRYPSNLWLRKWDEIRASERPHRTGRPAEALELRSLLRAAGFSRLEGSGALTSETGPPAGTIEATRAVAQSHLVRLRGLLGELALAQGWVTADELERIAEALVAWGGAPDAFYARPSFTAIGWA